MSLCPRCGSDRLIPLSFPEDEATDEVQQQPVLKCATCGYRIFETEITTSGRPDKLTGDPMFEALEAERIQQTGEMCLLTGKWQGDDEDRQLLDIKRGATIPVCPFCGRDIGWRYLHE